MGDHEKEIWENTLLVRIMSTATEPTSPTVSTSLLQKLSNLFVSPGEVFEEIAATPPRSVNWVVPTLLVCLAGTMSSVQSGEVATTQGMIAMLGLCASTLVGTFWSTFVLWFIGRVFLKTRFSYLKALEIVTLAGMILVLGTIVTGLLIAATGNADARPALSLFASNLAPTSRMRSALDLMNVFHLWTSFVLAIGLSKLSGVSFKESAFWILGYWILARVGILLLA
jgi:hypothetical protein